MKADNIIDGIMTHGRGAPLAKFHVESAYCIIPVHSHDRYLLGVKWQGEYFIDLALPCSLCPATFIFSSFGDLLEWIIKQLWNTICITLLGWLPYLEPSGLSCLPTKPGYLCSSLYGVGYSVPPMLNGSCFEPEWAVNMWYQETVFTNKLIPCCKKLCNYALK